MKFSVIRTSGNSKEKKPCECAVLKKYDLIEKHFRAEEEFNKNKSSYNPLWKDYGINHTTFEENGKTGIQRTILNHTENWEIEINSLEELIKFIDNIGYDIVIANYDINKSFPTMPIYQIEIYDDWRE